MNTLTIINDKIYDPAVGGYVQADYPEALTRPDRQLKMEAASIPAALAWLYPEFPPNGRLYHGAVARDRDVTPFDQASIRRLLELEGDFYLVIYPEGGVVSAIVAVVVAVTAVASFFLKPSVPTPVVAQQRNNVAQSPNNSLAARSNNARPNGRIADIFGLVRSTPDLITVPILQYIDNVEVEDAVMCIGRGQYEIHDARDGQTPINEIDGATVQAYKPNTPINSGTPYYRVGLAISEPSRMAVRANSVNGQELQPPNGPSFNAGATTLTFKAPNMINLVASTEHDGFDDVFEPEGGLRISYPNFHEPMTTAGVKSRRSSIIPAWLQVATGSSMYYVCVFIPYKDAAQSAELKQIKSFQVTNHPWGDGTGPLDYFMSRNNSVIGYTTGNGGAYDVVILNVLGPSPMWQQPAAVTADYTTSLGACILSGDYTTLGVTKPQLSLANPATVNSDWNALAAFPNQRSDPQSNVTLSSISSYVGWFNLDLKDRTEVWCNFVAMNGLYKDNGKTQQAVDIDILVTIQQIDANGNPLGSEYTYTTTVSGSASSKSTKATTFKVTTPFTGPCRVKCQRLTITDYEFQGTVMDEVKWRDLYAIAPLPSENFGDCTIVRSRTYGTSGALAVKERRLNMLVTRQIPRRISGADFTAELYSSRDVADILSFICLDPKIGNRSKAEVDFDGIYNTIAEVKEYFGTPLAAEFNYTIDSDNLTFEETVSMVADAAFCRAYRRGSVIRLVFEKRTDKSSLLFNHRNKMPGSETRSVTFGYQNENDGVEYEYVSPEDDSTATIYIPADRSALNPQKHESVGIRSKVQAHLHAWRLYNRIMHQHTAAEFEATQEANLLLIGDRVIVADNTVPATQDGEITGQDGLVLFTSQAVRITPGDHIFLQYADGSVESIAISAGPTEYSVTLATAPQMPLALEPGLYANTTYVISSPQDSAHLPFLVASIDVKADFSAALQLINYSDAYYANDNDFINGVITQ